MKIWFDEFGFDGEIENRVIVEGEFIREDVEEGYVYLEVDGKEECFEIGKIIGYKE